MNQRRTLIVAATAAAGALISPLSARAQQAGTPAGKTWRIGYLAQTTRAAGAAFYAAFVQRLSEIGYVEGRNLVLEARFADGDVSRLSGLAAELVLLKADLIITMANLATQAAQAATSTIPIVMPSTADPVGLGLVKSLARPGGNVTGISDLSVELVPKRLEMLLAMTAGPSSNPGGAKPPKVSRVAVLAAAATPFAMAVMGQLQDAGARLGVSIVPLYASTPEAIDQAFAAMRQQSVHALLLLPTPVFTLHRSQLAELAAKHRLPVSAAYANLVESGCLMSYGADLLDNMKRAAGFVDKIFKGAKPADLPVEQPVKFELVINGKTAKALGLKIPQALLISADRVIE